MNGKKVKVKVLKEEMGYSASVTIRNYHIFTDGDSLIELKANLIEAMNLAFEEENLTFEQYDLKFEYDLESFFAFYRVINAKALSERIGMNQSLLAQYISGIKKPSPAQTKRILKGVQQIGKELTEVQFIL